MQKLIIQTHANSAPPFHGFKSSSIIQHIHHDISNRKLSFDKTAAGLRRLIDKILHQAMIFYPSFITFFTPDSQCLVYLPTFWVV